MKCKGCKIIKGSQILDLFGLIGEVDGFSPLLWAFYVHSFQVGYECLLRHHFHMTFVKALDS